MRFSELDAQNKSTIVLFLLGILNYSLQFVFTSYLTHHLAPALYGDFYLSLSILAITANFSLLGTQTTAVKFLPSYLHLEDSSVLKNFLAWVIKAVTISFITCFVLSFLIGGVIFFFHAMGIKNVYSYDLVIFTLWITPFAAFALLLQKFILSNDHPIASYLLQNDFTYLLQLALFILAISLFEIRLDNLSFALILIFSYTILILIALIFIKNHNKKLFSFLTRNLVAIHSKVHPEWKKMSLKVILSGLVYMIINSMDLFILKLITPYKNQVGMYSVVWVICNIFTLVPQSIYTLVLPKIDLYTRKNSEYSLQEFQKLLNKINGIVFIILAGLLAICLIWGREILVLFSSAYGEAYNVLVICVITSFIMALSVSAANLLLYSTNINTLLAIDVVNLMLTLLLGVTLTYYYTIIGISLACLISQCIVTILLVYYSYKRTRIKSIIIA